MTDEQKIQMLWDAIQRDGDETSAEAYLALVKRAEQAERERDEARRDFAATTATALHHADRATRAEASLSVRTAEYDEMQRSQEAGAERIRELMAQVQRAEADNAEAVEALEVCREAMQEEGWDEYAGGHPKRRAYEATLSPSGADHPGAALLEEHKQCRAMLNEYLAALGTPAEGGDGTQYPSPGAVRKMLERVRALEDAATKASAELRHTYRPETRDWNLVARAISILEMATTPKTDALKVPRE